MPIKAVIFDLDGTLTGFNLDYKTLRAEVRGYLISRGIPASLLKVNESIFEMLQKTEIYFKNRNKQKTFEEINAECLGKAEKHEIEAAKTTSLLPGAVVTLRELQKMEIKVGLCTTSSQVAADYILKKFKISDFFEVVVPRNKVKNVKPDPEQYEIALKTLNVQSDSALIVGDSKADMESAKELKAIAVGLPTGLSTKEELTEYGANYILTALSDLLILIKKINND